MQNKKFKSIKIGLLLSLLVFILGCAPATNNLSFLKLKGAPTTQILKDPSFESRKLKTFSVIPISKCREKPFLTNRIIEMHLLFFLRSFLEGNGYLFVDIKNNPDFLVTIDGLSPYQETYIPPQTFTTPKWVPGEEITTRSTTSGTMDFYGGLGFIGPRFGRYSGSSSSTTYLPGYMTTETYTIPGQSVGNYYPGISIFFLEPTNFKQLWTGYGAGISDIGDLRISSQALVVTLFNGFPNGPLNGRVEAFIKTYGFEFGVLTFNGNDYYPLLEIKSEIAKSSGLRHHDIIISVNGIPTKNKSTFEVARLFNQATQNPVIPLRINRLNHYCPK